MGNNKIHSINNGFQFQTDAAICIFLRNIQSICKLKVEGKFEDVEVYLDNGIKIFSQAKSKINIYKNK